ncbi:hypothetical protein SF83666_c02250 [Sinorhizobium fredii CCBAU 83666]|nr:hypothetical protein SF83666_c02250 [Sinorhizobium fredii CCBAU 83666]
MRKTDPAPEAVAVSGATSYVLDDCGAKLCAGRQGWIAWML